MRRGRRSVGRGKLTTLCDITRCGLPPAGGVAAVTFAATPQTSLPTAVEPAFAVQPGVAARGGRTHPDGGRRGRDCAARMGNAAIRSGDCRVGSAPATAPKRGGRCDGQSWWRSMSRPLRCRPRPTAPNSTVRTTHTMMSHKNQGIGLIVALAVNSGPLAVEPAPLAVDSGPLPSDPGSLQMSRPSGTSGVGKPLVGRGQRRGAMETATPRTDDVSPA